MRRLTKRARSSRNKRIVITSTLCLLLCLCVGYAAFSSQLSLKAKGNIKERKAADQLLENVVDSGDGLYKDEYEDGRYFYKGVNPNNYITFNNEAWRIISVEKDGTIDNGNNDLMDQINDEKQKQWTGKIALITASEYIKSNSNKNDCGSLYLINRGYNTCQNTTWMFKGESWWQLSPIGISYASLFINGVGSFSDAGVYNTYNIRPALYLSSKISLSGTGTEQDPYQIVE